MSDYLTQLDKRYAKPYNYEVTLTTNWTSQGSYVTQDVTVTGITAADNPVVDIVTSTSNYEAEQEAWGKVFKGITSANKITFYASEATETALTLLITGSRTTS